MNKKTAIEIVQKLQNMYPDAKCSLDFSTPFEMLIAVCLSAQCTDDRVNLVTPNLFRKYNTPEKIASADVKDIEELIHSCGFFKNKAKNLKAAGRKIIDDFNGEVPKTIEELITIPGVGRKSANVIMLEAFDNPQGIAVDTHCKRIANRIGFSKQIEPSKIESDLCKLIPKEYWKDVNHILIWHGRNICSSQRPKCEKCELKMYCKFFKSTKKTG